MRGEGKGLEALLANRRTAILADLVLTGVESLERSLDLVDGVGGGSELLEHDTVRGDIGGEFFQICEMVVLLGSELIQARLDSLLELPQPQP